ncbi:MAG TPA: response regulator [Parafilimonas sp.]|nr:response regulator [Parafilimonas sp.]
MQTKLKSILIIDDDTRNTFALSAVLKTKGYETFISSNMVEAFAALESEKEIGIILLDMMMPGMDGYDAMPVIRSTEAYKHLPLIAITAQAMPGDREKCMAAGADDYVAKPVDVDLLLNILDKYLK